MNGELVVEVEQLTVGLLMQVLASGASQSHGLPSARRGGTSWGAEAKSR